MCTVVKFNIILLLYQSFKKRNRDMTKTTSYVTDTFSKFVADRTAKIKTSEDMYDEQSKLSKCNDGADPFSVLINNAAYAEILYNYRLKNYEAAESANCSNLEIYESPLADAQNQVLDFRDMLLDFCEGHGLDYEKVIE